MTRRMRSGGRALAVVTASALLLVGCAGLPTEGAVQSGASVAEGVSDARWQFQPDGPDDGESPEAIVLGFLDAAESPADDWSIAREFLSAEAAATWDPERQITVDAVNDREVGDFEESPSNAESGFVDVRVTPTATVDDRGEYEIAAEEVRRPLEIRLALEEGEWRIDDLPDGVIVPSGSFESIFSPQSLYYSAPGDRLVPDVRWFPETSTLAERMVEELVEGGPASWLEVSVSSAFGEDDTVRRVDIDDDHVATVTLSPTVSEADEARRARMLTQVQTTLAGIGVEGVRMIAAGEVVDTPPDDIASTEGGSRAIAMTDEGFGYVVPGEAPQEIPGLSAVMEERFAEGASAEDPATSITLSADLSQAAVQSESEAIWRVRGDGSFQPLTYEEGWVRPSLDPFDYVWSAQADAPERLHAWGADDEPVDVTGLGGLTEVADLEVSRDGARIAVAGRIDDQWLLVLAGIRRDDEGQPVGLSNLRQIGLLTDEPDRLTWVADDIVAVTLPGDGRTIIGEHNVGAGTPERLTASFVVTAMTYGNVQSNERLLAGDGSLYVRKAPTWTQAGTGVRVLATQMGSLTLQE
ncbi:LpqB family beta-propeller domain-containing protein [Microbacterium sp. G2-8]|uniref:LpqB family beta-propeller domain-containing protein n=1 Tax=Microbacterium sp. G2-8 TaxID=2842454 RepID=UPI001C8ACAB9|nr:LpqB family beta-propeller domain-containing protein [Microbacterium sp. G2-8]